MLEIPCSWKPKLKLERRKLTCEQGLYCTVPDYGWNEYGDFVNTVINFRVSYKCAIS
jgi:hypothetical protein